MINYFKRMRIPTRKQIREYYPKYLMAHRHPMNKILHIFGNALTVGFIAGTALCVAKVSPYFLPLFILTPFVVYLGAWPGHKFFEKNKPATFYMNPLLTKTCDWIMMKDLFVGNLPLDTRGRINQLMLDFSKGSASFVKHIGYILETKKDKE